MAITAGGQSETNVKCLDTTPFSLSAPFDLLGFPIYLARVPAARFTRCCLAANASPARTMFVLVCAVTPEGSKNGYSKLWRATCQRRSVRQTDDGLTIQ